MLRFTIRDLLWLTTLVAVLIAWGIDRARTRINWQQVKAVERRLEQTTQALHWAEIRVQTARQQQTQLVRAAARRGLTPLDIESETTLKKSLLPDD